MRRFFLAAVMFGAATGAQAADMPDFLHGSLPATNIPTRNWDGWYVGGQVGESWTNTDYRRSAVTQTNDLFRNTTLQGPASQLNVMGKVNGQSSGFGGFVGRNWQFDDVVLGIEANYNYFSNLATSTGGSIGPIQVAEPGLVLPPGDTAVDDVTLTGHAKLRVKDQVTFRGRAGWATGDFLPYMFGGLAVGRMDVSSTISSSVIRTVNDPVTGSTSFPLPQFALSSTIGKSDAFVVGWTAGLGLEYMLWSNIFLRGEWEYTQFMSIQNTTVSENSVQAGLGYKF
ncbi:MAG: outer membrane beta-barrel protein [Bradyrhizobium sp.]|nr:outer membrane beta-barrel protein [Bradyrhizobium sp.]